MRFVDHRSVGVSLPLLAKDAGLVQTTQSGPNGMEAKGRAGERLFSLGPHLNCRSQGNQMGFGYSVCWAAMRRSDSPDNSDNE